MSCITQDDMARLAADDLVSHDRKRLLEHLSRCAPCRRRWLDAALAADLSAEPFEEAPEGLKERVKRIPRRGADGSTARSPWLGNVPWLGRALALAATLVRRLFSAAAKR